MIVQLRLEEFIDVSELVITGHSLGGALTCLNALDFQLRQDRFEMDSKIKISAYPLASPRTGNHEFREIFNRKVSSCDRLVLEADMVPRVPPKSIGFHHVGRKIKLQSKE